jgi:DNA polymerase V
MVVMDKLNERYGRNTVKVSAQGVSAAWQMKQERKSPNYTTSWDEMPVV